MKLKRLKAFIIILPLIIGGIIIITTQILGNRDMSNVCIVFLVSWGIFMLLELCMKWKVKADSSNCIREYVAVVTVIAILAEGLVYIMQDLVFGDANGIIVEPSVQATIGCLTVIIITSIYAIKDPDGMFGRFEHNGSDDNEMQ